MDRILIEKVQNLRNEGKSFGEISKELLITKSNASYCSKIDLNKYDAKMASRDKYIDTVCALAKKCSNMSKGKKFNTPKRFWNKMPHKKSWKAHVMSSNHKKFKWFFRKKKWFTEESIKRMAMRFPMSHEIWCWD